MDSSVGVTEDFGRRVNRLRSQVMETEQGNRGSRSEAMTQLSKIYGDNKFWQKCLMVNALCENQINVHDYPIIQVVALSTVVCSKIGNDIHHRENCKISGLYAHGIKLSKVGQGINSQINISLLPESNLSPSAMNKIMTEGLYDIPTVIKEANKKRYPFIYQLEPNYRMSAELMSCIVDEYKGFEERKHIDQVEEKINEIPPEAFEQANNMRSGIGSLEV